MGIRATFDKEIEVLQENLLQMAECIECAINHSILSMQEKNKELALAVIGNDDEVDNWEKLIERQCLSLLLRQQPVAHDLRIISTALKMITDMERIGDHAVDIAELGLEMAEVDTKTVTNHLAEMSDTVIKMVHFSITSFVKHDVELAQATMKEDDTVDQLFQLVKEDVVKYAKQGEHLEQVIIVLMIAKYLERIADHAVNICEWTEFCVTGRWKNAAIL